MLTVVLVACHNHQEYDGIFVSRNPGENAIVLPPDFTVMTDRTIQGITRGDDDVPELLPEPGEDDNPANYRDVEINLAVNVELLHREADYVSKLSCHLRFPTDIEIIIPVPTKFYLSYAELKTFGGNLDAKPLFSGLSYSLDYPVIDDSQGRPLYVTLTTEYVASGKNPRWPEGYIRIATAGCHAENDNPENPIDRLYDYYADGINFEILSYFNYGDYLYGSEMVTSDRAFLKELMDNSVITFSRIPDIYVNALSKVWEEGHECIVSIDDTQRSYFGEPETGGHKNGSTNNIIYNRL